MGTGAAAAAYRLGEQPEVRVLEQGRAYALVLAGEEVVVVRARRINRAVDPFMIWDSGAGVTAGSPEYAARYAFANWVGRALGAPHVDTYRELRAADAAWERHLRASTGLGSPA